MYIYLDESGDLGFAFDGKHPSNYFVITVLICLSRKSAKSFDAAVRKTIQNKLNRKSGGRIIHELKGYATSFGIKEYFYKHIKIGDSWELRSIVLNKRAFIKQYKINIDKDRLYNILVHKLLSKIDYENADIVNLIVDKSKSGSNLKEFDDYLRMNLDITLPLQTPFNITHEASHENKGIQAVDMFSHGIFRKYEHSDTLWYNCYCEKLSLEEKIDSV